jgi:hypothetical protein
MLADIKDFIEKQLSEHKRNIALEDLELLGDSKVAATISTPHLMGSIEILRDLTTDLLIAEFESEDILYSKTYESISHTEALKEIIQNYLQEVDRFEAKYQMEL